VQQLTMPLGNRVRPKWMGEKRVHKDEQGEQAGNPSNPPTQHNEKAGDHLEGAEYHGPGRYGSAREYASAYEQALETETDEHAWN
jgi:hypothetical protein